MKKYVIALVLILGMAVSVFASDDPNYTDNLNLWKPDGDDRTAALADANDNWETLDDILAGVDNNDWGLYHKYVGTTVGAAGSDNWGLKVRASTTADNTTLYTLRGANIEGKVSAGGECTTIEGATITAHTEIGGVNPAAVSLRGLMVEAKANSGVSTEMIGQDIRMFRQAAMHPTTEGALRIRCGNTSGTGIDYGISLESSYSGEFDDFGYGIDMNSANIDTAEIRLQNEETIANTTDDMILFSGGNGSDNTDLQIDLDGTYPLITSPTDTLVGLGKVIVIGPRTAVTGYENLILVDGALTGTGTQGNTRGIYVDLDRAAGSNTTVGDQNDIGVQVRVTNAATANTAGNTLQALDAQAENESSGVITNLVGGTLTAYNKTGGGDVVSAIGMRASAKANYAVTGTLIGAEIQVNRQSATVPTEEGVLALDCNSMTGTGADYAIKVSSIYGGSATTDSFNDGIRLDDAVVNQAQIVFSNGSKLFVGAQTSENGVYGEVGAYDAVGSVYFATNGKIFVQVADNGAAADWEIVTSASAE